MNQTSLYDSISQDDLGCIKTETPDTRNSRITRLITNTFTDHPKRTLMHFIEAMRTENNSNPGYVKITQQELTPVIQHLMNCNYMTTQSPHTYVRIDSDFRVKPTTTADRDRIGNLKCKRLPVAPSHVLRGFPDYPAQEPKGRHACIYAIYNRAHDAIHVEVTTMGFAWDKNQAKGKMVLDGTFYPAASPRIERDNPDAYLEGRLAVTDAFEDDLYFVPLYLGRKTPTRWHAQYNKNGLSHRAYDNWADAEKERLMAQVRTYRDATERTRIKTWIRGHLPKQNTVARRNALLRLAHGFAMYRNPSSLSQECTPLDIL